PPSTTYTLSLHDALPIFAFCMELARRHVYVNLQMDALRNPELRVLRGAGDHQAVKERALANLERAGVRTTIVATVAKGVNDDQRSEEHTSELQSRGHLVC